MAGQTAVFWFQQRERHTRFSTSGERRRKRPFTNHAALSLERTSFMHIFTHEVHSLLTESHTMGNTTSWYQEVALFGTDMAMSSLHECLSPRSYGPKPSVFCTIQRITWQPFSHKIVCACQLEMPDAVTLFGTQIIVCKLFVVDGCLIRNAVTLRTFYTLLNAATRMAKRMKYNQYKK